MRDVVGIQTVSMFGDVHRGLSVAQGEGIGLKIREDKINRKKHRAKALESEWRQQQRFTMLLSSCSGSVSRKCWGNFQGMS